MGKMMKPKQIELFDFGKQEEDEEQITLYFRFVQIVEEATIYR